MLLAVVRPDSGHTQATDSLLVAARVLAVLHDTSCENYQQMVGCGFAEEIAGKA